VIEITRLEKAGGPLTKRISLGPDGSLVSDGSACVMASGAAWRVRLAHLGDLAKVIGTMQSNEAISLGTLRADLPDNVEIVTKGQLNGTPRRDVIARSGDYITYRPEQAGVVLFDLDTKGMPESVKQKMTELGGFWSALQAVLPHLGRVARVARASTSAGLFRTDTGEKLRGSDGQHVFIGILDGADAERFLKELHARCWLAGFGWMLVSSSGQLLERSIVDRMVGGPERIVFEGAPVLVEPLAQDEEARRPVVIEGEMLDTIASCPPLSLIEQARLRELRTKETHRLSSEASKAREDFISRRSKQLVESASISMEAARRVIERQCSGILLPDVALVFDEDDLADATVADVLADPDRFVGATLADPLEGLSYGRCKAKVMRRPNGTIYIHSFAHGRSIYELKLDARSCRAAVEKAEKDEVVDVFIRSALLADLTEDQIEDLRNLAANRSGAGKRVLDKRLKGAVVKQASQRAAEERARRAAERVDPRPQVPAPAKDAEWLPQMQLLNDVLGASQEPEPPMRDLDGHFTQVRSRSATSMHTLTTFGANGCDTDETRIPAPEQALLTRIDDMQLAETIERYIEYTNRFEDPVHLGEPFVRHFLRRDDGVLPIVNSVATLPMVLADGTILSGHGLVRERGIVFRVPDELQKLLPNFADCTPTGVAEAMGFLMDGWLYDVATEDYAAKCVLLAFALTVIERLLLPERPAFFITAGQRGGGKTTCVNMISTAVLGHRASAAAWSPSDEERRKALLAHFGEGVPMLTWDNIKRGTAISCPSIERALTTETYTDRVLGISETRTVAAATVMSFTGNNITARGDLSSRRLTSPLAVDRLDPENRSFRHSDPIAWTYANRGRILRAMYIVLLGNPRLRCNEGLPPQTRFKVWYELVGSAVEHAAKMHAEHVKALMMDAHPTCKPGTGRPVDFKALFLEGESDEEQTSGLITVVRVLRQRWPEGCTAKEVANFIKEADQGNTAAIEFAAALDQANDRSRKTAITTTAISWRLKALAGAPVKVDEHILRLDYLPANQAGTFIVRIIS
jgi:hypothetical protein